MSVVTCVDKCHICNMWCFTKNSFKNSK